MSRRRLLAVATALVVVVAAAVVLGLRLAGDDEDGAHRLAAGPLHDTGSMTLTGVNLRAWPTRVMSGVVEATFEGDQPAEVSTLRLIPVPGFPTPKLVEAGYLVNRYGSERGRPSKDFAHGPLLHHTITPPKTSGAGILLVLKTGATPGLYAVAGVELDYTIGETSYRSRIYTAVTGCVPEPGHKDCPQKDNDAIFDKVAKLAGMT